MESGKYANNKKGEIAVPVKKEEERERKEERMSEGKKSEKSDLLAYFIFMLKSVMVKNTGFDQMQKDKYCYDLT